MAFSRYLLLLLACAGLPFVARADHPQYPMQRPARATPAAPAGDYTIHLDQPRQLIEGLGFEIQSDSIGSANQGLPELPISVPHDLTPPERQRFYKDMLSGFRYCRLAGGLYWRGTDVEKKTLQGRWPTQMAELQEMIRVSGIEGVSLEYWSPAPFWKANESYVGPKKETNVLKPFGPNFASDPVYKGDSARFFADFGQALVHDIRFLENLGIKVSFWGLQNEPRSWSFGNDYSRCAYTKEQYVTAFRAVAPAIRAHNPAIRIIADTWHLHYAAPLMADPSTRGLIDALVLHHVGSDANIVQAEAAAAYKRFGRDKPLFQNEYEYLNGQTTPARCMNTVLHIMNWFQLGEAPSWFWIHALKPITNAEASGYSLGFWRPANDKNPADHPKFPGLKPGHWTWNPYNWNAVGSFVNHLPWNSRAVAVTEAVQDPDLRIFAFTRPDGKLVITLANRSFTDHTFKLTTGLGASTRFKGYRYTPDNAGPDTMGVPIGELSGDTLALKVADMSWEFWVQQ